jgi:hypothetical protein
MNRKESAAQAPQPVMEGAVEALAHRASRGALQKPRRVGAGRLASSPASSERHVRARGRRAAATAAQGRAPQEARNPSLGGAARMPSRPGLAHATREKAGSALGRLGAGNASRIRTRGGASGAAIDVQTGQTRRAARCTTLKKHDTNTGTTRWT